MQTTVTVAGKTTDVVNTTFGIRSAVFDASNGLLLNGFSVKVYGMCNHQVEHVTLIGRPCFLLF
jgi:beta-galactosidase